MENEIDPHLDVKAQAAYEAYWRGFTGVQPTSWWLLHNDHRRRWREVVKAIRNRKKGKTNV